MSLFLANNKPINVSIPPNLTIYIIYNFNPNNFDLRPYPFLGMVTSYILIEEKSRGPISVASYVFA